MKLLKPNILLVFIICFALSLKSENIPYTPSILVSPVCDLIVTQPDNLHICDGENFDFCVTVATSYPHVELEWFENGSPANYDLCDDTDITENTTFTLNITATSDDNLITNGDFENGDDGSFTSDYTSVGPGSPDCYGEGYLDCEGTYAVMDNPNDGHNHFSNCTDNSGSGLMMAVNGAGALQEIWCQNVCVDPDASYLFSAWATSIESSSPAQLQFSIDGTLIGSLFGLNGSTCDWEQFESDWQANGETNIEICVTNQNTAAGGNDFALDDLAFYQVCHETIEYEVIISDLEISGDDPEDLTCVTNEVEITIEIDTPFNYTDVIWDTDNGYITQTINGDLTAVVDEPGTYTVLVIDEFGCAFEEEFFVYQNIQTPRADLVLSNPLDCENNYAEIDAITDTYDDEYNWADANGLFLGDDDHIEIMNAGTYFVTVTDTENGCTEVAQLEVTATTVLPNFELQSSNNLTCNSLTSTITTNDTFAEVNWSTLSGQVISDTDNTITVSLPDSYIAFVSLGGGCTHRDTIEVIEISPSFQYTTDSVNIDCHTPIGRMHIDLDTSLYNIAWQGSAASFGHATSISTETAGTYFFILTDSNGCTHQESITIDSIPPSFYTLPSSGTDITCNVNGQLIVADAQTIGLIDYILWILPDGTSDSTSTNILSATQPGWTQYEAVGLDGCSYSDSIFIDRVGDFPTVSVIGDIITCSNPETTLSPIVNEAVTYQWALPNGTTINDSLITTNQPGTYELIVTNQDGCSSSSSYTVQALLNEPTLQPLPDLILDCNIRMGLVESTADINTPIEWTGPNLSSTDQVINVTEAGQYSLVATGQNGCTSMTSFELILDTIPPAFSLSSPEILNCDLTSFIATIEMDSGAFNEAIWVKPTSGMVQGQAVSIDQPGIWQVTVYSENGCSTVTNYEVLQTTDTPDINISGTIFSCNVPMSEITVTSPDNLTSIEYFQDDISIGTGSTFTVFNPDLITIVIVDENGCRSTHTYAPPTDLDRVAFTLRSDQLTCNTQGTTIEVISNDVIVEALVYTNDFNLIGDINTLITEPAAYIVVVTGENGCEERFRIDVTIDDTIVDFTAEGLTLDCKAPSGSIMINNFTPYVTSALINDNGEEVATAFSFEELIATEGGLYTVVITGANGCTSEQEVEVLTDFVEPDFNLSTLTLDCNLTSVPILLNAPNPYSSAELLDPTGQILESNNFGESFSEVTNGGTYAVIVTGQNGCTTTKEIEVQQDTVPLNLLLQGRYINCQNDPIMLGVLTDQNYDEAWIVQTATQEQSVLMGPAFIIDAPGFYDVTIIANNGCATEQTIEILRDPNVPIIQSFIAQTLTCMGSGQLSNLEIEGGLPPYTVTVDNVMQSPSDLSYILEELGPHSIFIQDANGCTHDTIFTTEPLPEVEAFIEPEISVVANVDLSLSLEINKEAAEIASIAWMPSSGLSCADCLSPTFNGAESTAYEVTVIDIYGCEATVRIRVEVFNEFTLYIPNVLDISSSSSAPDNRFTIFTGEEDIDQITSLHIYDRWGNLVFLNENFPHSEPTEGWDGLYGTEPAMSGVYVYAVVVRYHDGEEELFVGDVTLLR